MQQTGSHSVQNRPTVLGLRCARTEPGSHNPSTEPILKPTCILRRVASLIVVVLALLASAQMGHALAQTPKPATRLPSGEPCSVLPLSEVQRAFPGAKPGERSTRIEKYGLTECQWKDSSGVVVFGVQEFYGNDTAMAEAEGMAIGFIDRSKPGAARNVRYEILNAVGLGNGAVAFVEVSDAKRGILSDGAMLVLHRGERTLFLTSPSLQQRDRASALKTLEDLGRIAAKRLD